VSYGPYSKAFITREGLPVEVNELDVVLEGKRGRLFLHHRIEWFDAGNRYGIGLFSWRILRGTGAYAGLRGGGRGSTTWLPSASGPVSGRWEGFVYPRH
jgi:hypothetical protein